MLSQETWDRNGDRFTEGESRILRSQILYEEWCVRVDNSGRRQTVSSFLRLPLTQAMAFAIIIVHTLSDFRRNTR
jgi:hypothetical protein